MAASLTVEILQKLQFFKIYGRWSSFRASTSFRVFAAYLTISQPI